MPVPVPPPASPPPGAPQGPHGTAWTRRVNHLLSSLLSSLRSGLQSGLKVRHRFAALGVVGALMCVLPLLQVLRYQADALGATRAAQAALDPLAHAVGVQRGLVLHRDVAGAVLRGAGAREPERRQRQRVVDERLTDLEVALRASDHTRATEEGEALRADWTALSRRVEERSLAAADSDAAHRLLVEQTLQVVDELSAAAWQPGGLAASDVNAWLRPVLHTLPRLSARLGLLASAEPGSAEAHPREFAAAQQRLAQVLTEISALGAPSGNGSDASHGGTHSTHSGAFGSGPGHSLAAAAQAALQQQAEHYFSLQRSSAPPAQLRAAAVALGEAEAAFTAQAQARLAAALAAREAQLRTQGLALGAALAVLLVLGTALGLSLLPPPTPGARRGPARPALRRFNAADPASPDSLPEGLPGEQAPPAGHEARRLMQRLRTPDERSPGTPQDTSSPQTLPPEN